MTFIWFLVWAFSETEGGWQFWLIVALLVDVILSAGAAVSE